LVAVPATEIAYKESPAFNQIWVVVVDLLIFTPRFAPLVDTVESPTNIAELSSLNNKTAVFGLLAGIVAKRVGLVPTVIAA
jgi:hypothetical protein